jgi:hypothetical protein
MRLKPAIPAIVFAAVSLLGTVLPMPNAQAKDNEHNQRYPVLYYECYNAEGNIAFTTTEQRDTIGWSLGCRQVRYIVEEPPLTRTDYYQCYNVLGDVALTAVDPNSTRDRLTSGDYNHHPRTRRVADLGCGQIGHRNSSPDISRAVHYQCYNVNGGIAFTTIYPQDTYGWKPGCSEVARRTDELSQSPTASPPVIQLECYDRNGNLVLTTTDPRQITSRVESCRVTPTQNPDNQEMRR